MSLLLDRYTEILERLRAELVAHDGPRLVSVAVFGSVGRGTPRQDSDVDVLIVARDLPRGRTARVEEFLPVEARVDSCLSTVPVLIFRRAETTEQQIAFTKNFGELEPPYTQIGSPEGSRLDNRALSDISNLGPGDRILAREDRKRLFGLGNQLWHSDSSYKVIPARYSLLCGHVIPPEGGNTEFADMRAAYDMLDPKTKVLIEDLVCEHSRIFSKGALGFSFTDEELCAFAPVRQRLVRTHRRTGRKSLYLSSHAGRILGWPVPEALLLLRELTEHATQREFVYSHTWRVGDLVMWDNRVTMHRARRYEDELYPRDLRRTTLTDGVPTVEQEAAQAVGF